MALVPTPNYVTTEECYNYSGDTYEKSVLPAGSFARPIQRCYVPKDVLEDRRWSYKRLDDYEFCYTRFGIIPIPKSALRQA